VGIVAFCFCGNKFECWVFVVRWGLFKYSLFFEELNRNNYQPALIDPKNYKIIKYKKLLQYIFV
jgi:hypothetical protein